jgi:hypothetical protein
MNFNRIDRILKYTTEMDLIYNGNGFNMQLLTIVNLVMIITGITLIFNFLFNNWTKFQ